MSSKKDLSSAPAIEVAVALPVFSTFTYGTPEILAGLISVGKRVLVPFGQRRVTGYILGPSDDAGTMAIKQILDLLDDTPIFPASMIPFFRWIASYYLHPIGEVIRSALPGGLNLYESTTINITPEGCQTLAGNACVTPLEREILTSLQKGTCQVKELGRRIGKDIPGCLLQRMEHSGRITRQRQLKGGRTRPKMERHVSLKRDDCADSGLSGTRREILDLLYHQKEISLKELQSRVPAAGRLIKPLEKKGFISIIDKKVYRDPFGEPIASDTAPLLNEEQKQVVETIAAEMGEGYAAFLLAGVTGSGKTEAYMQLAAEAIRRGYRVVVLVPEIALISQMERRFRARFGECIAVLHSGLSAGERYDQWLRIVRGEAVIAVGARSAVFAPFEEIGLIIVDEEHDGSYKQESSLRYNARDLAVVRAKLLNGIALLGSATPSIQSYHNVKTLKFKEVTLKKRVQKRPMPEISVVDLRQSRDTRGIRRFITPELQKAMRETLDRGEQVLLFLNRRGYASFPVCAACGEAIKCKNCDISLTLHQRANAYKCHFCGFSRAAASNCPSCGSSKIKLLGLGTEKVEGAVKALFPAARIARMDRDTTVRKDSIVKLLKGLRNRSIDVLVGTQMVAKGHDFPHITLVGIICADLSLSFPDFRAGERTFQILAQVAGRAGRGSAPGRVILQTYNPNHFSIVSARDQDFISFYSQEIRFRSALNYPPFSKMIQLKVSGRDVKKTRQAALTLGDLCSALKSRGGDYKTIEMLGPIEAPLPKIARRYRWQILLKCPSMRSLQVFMQQMLEQHGKNFSGRDIKVVVDVDPLFLM